MIVHLLKTNAGKLDKHNAACDVTSTKSNAEINLVTCSKCKAIHNRYYESSYVMAEDDPFAQKTLKGHIIERTSWAIVEKTAKGILRYQKGQRRCFMTHKQLYSQLAEVLQRAKQDSTEIVDKETEIDHSNGAVFAIVMDLSKVLENNDKKFNRERFITYCGWSKDSMKYWDNLS